MGSHPAFARAMVELGGVGEPWVETVAVPEHSYATFIRLWHASKLTMYATMELMDRLSNSTKGYASADTAAPAAR